jgi:UDP-GlcNAc:undecaprenyl-phosphate/decaprenyl-phosphate GlcNAc-1-phosphate transferase
MSSASINVLLLLVVAMSISMALIPLMIRFAPALGMIDKPDPRKVHSKPIPRVGGVGIVLGALAPLLIWLPMNDLTISYLLGSLILLMFGLWDDARELGHARKFVGQFAAVVLVVYYGGLFVSILPFQGMEPINETLGQLFTVFALVGMINAINHSDGLDGLAGGESVMSLAAITFLAYMAGDPVVAIIAFAAIGGLLGFLRFNSHPARVFMGDGGSQFLGFTLGFLAVYLTQISNPALSPALPALLLGLPIVDILAVLAQRAYHGQNWFRASKNHIHHRLLALNFHHYESVIIIYSVQALLVISAVLLPYESDSLVLGLYLAVCSAMFLFLIVAENKGWRAHKGNRQGALVRFFVGIKGDGKIVRADRYLIQGLLAAFMLTGVLFSTEMPRDMSIASAVLFTMLLIRLVAGYRLWFLFLRLIIFVAVAFIAYLFEYYPPELLAADPTAYYLFYVVLAIAVGLSIRYSQGRIFEVTPLDYLVVLIVVALALLSEKGFVNLVLVRMGVELIILFYGAEVVIKQMKNRWNLFTTSMLVALAFATVRGLM